MLYLSSFYCFFFSDFKEQTFSAIFKDYDKFKKQKIVEFEKEETDTTLHLITGIAAI